MSSFSIFADSRDRDNGTNNYFSVLYPSVELSQTPVAVSLDSCIIPNMVFPIRSGNNAIVINEGGADLTATIAAGYYDKTSFLTALKDALDLAGALTYTCTISSTTNYLTISATGAFTLKISSSGTAWRVLGFSSTYSTNAASHTGTMPVRLDGEDYVALELGNISNDNMVSNFNSRGVLDYIPLNGAFGDVIYFKNNDQTGYSVVIHENLQEVRIRLRTADGYDFNLPDNAYCSFNLRCTSIVADL